MELALNKEGIQYMLGVPLGNPETFLEISANAHLGIPFHDTRTFSQICLHPGEVEGLPKDVRVPTFNELADAQRVRQIIQSRYSRPIAIYQVRLERLQD